MWIICAHVSSSIRFHTGRFMPGAGSCTLKCISDGFHMAEQNEKAGLEEMSIQNKYASHSPMDLGFFPSFGIVCVCVCVCERERAWPSGREVSCNTILLAWPEVSYLSPPSALQTSNTTQPQSPDAHLGSPHNPEPKLRFWHVSISEFHLHGILGGALEFPPLLHTGQETSF